MPPCERRATKCARSRGMKWAILLLISPLASLVTSSAAEEVESAHASGFANFDGWQWVRPDHSGWRIEDSVLLIRSDPGALAFDNNNTNMPLHATPGDRFRLEVTVEFAPQSLYEQAGLVLYEDDDYVKFQYERTEAGRGVTFTFERRGEFGDIGFQPLESGPVRLQLEYRDGCVRARAKRPADADWMTLGVHDFPSRSFRVGLATGAGSAVDPRWASYSDFILESL